jgi:hypothetical protein
MVQQKRSPLTYRVYAEKTTAGTIAEIKIDTALVATKTNTSTG